MEFKLKCYKKYTITPLIIILLFLFDCKESSRPNPSIDKEKNLAIASEFIDAFYSFKANDLEAILLHAEDSKPRILFYQKWAECGNYKIINRHPCFAKNDTLIICPVTVKDDLIGALKLDFNVTDTFHVTIKDKIIRSVKTSSNDPALFLEAYDWVWSNRHELIEEPCRDIWNGGPTPCECVRAMVKGFVEFSSLKQNN